MENNMFVNTIWFVCFVPKLWLPADWEIRGLAIWLRTLLIKNPRFRCWLNMLHIVCVHCVYQHMPGLHCFWCELVAAVQLFGKVRLWNLASSQVKKDPSQPTPIREYYFINKFPQALQPSRNTCSCTASSPCSVVKRKRILHYTWENQMPRPETVS